MFAALASLATIVLVNAAPFDLLRKQDMDYNFMEVDYVRVDPFASNYNWMRITTTTSFPHEAIVFISIPDVAAITSAGESPSSIPPFVPKVNGLPVHNSDGTYTFEFKLVSVNDSFCSKAFGYNPNWKPSTTSLMEVSWMVAQTGAYSILSNETNELFNTNFIIGHGPITRASADPQATSSNGNAIQFNYPFGCVSPSERCTVQDPADVPGFTAGSGSIQQLQTSVNKVDGNIDMFLSVRAWQVRKRSSWFVLVPHDSLTPSYFVISTAETLGYLIFPTNQKIKCVEGFAFETMTFTNVTHRNVRLNYAFDSYNYPPGIFGMLGSVFSMVDSTTLSVYDRTLTNAIFITKEDQCASAQTIHTTPEIVHVMMFGELRSDSSGLLSCGTNYNPPDACVQVKAWKVNMPNSP